MANKILSQSLVGRDPFEEARKKFESKKGSVLSSSPDVPMAQGPVKADLSSLMQKIGINSAGLADNEIGRIQLVSRLREKLGDNFYQNPDALELLSSFDENAKLAGAGGLNQMITSGDRTLGAIFGGTSGV